MRLGERFERFEKMLSKFSIEEQQNYYKNKKTLIIEYNPNFESGGEYLSRENKIILRDETALEHELAHMAFNDKENYNTEFLPNFFQNNGIAYTDEEGKIYGIAIVEGFAQYLSKKTTSEETKGYSFETYIVELLISIHGEKICYDLLTNNPYYFYTHRAKESTLAIVSSLDSYKFSSDVMKLSCDLDNEYIDINALLFHFELIEIYAQSIIDSITGIIAEYNNCSNPKITRQELKNKIEKYLSTPRFLSNAKIIKIIGKDIKQEIDVFIDEELMGKKYIKH